MLDFIESAPVFTEQTVCQRADARCMASRLIRSLHAKESSPACFAYGNENEVLLCKGKQINSSQKGYRITDEAHTSWQEVNDIFEQHDDDYIFGFLGYGFGIVAHSEDDEQFPPYWFGVADLAIQCNPDGFTLLHGDAQALHLAVMKMANCACGKNKVELVAALDQSDEAHYLAQVEQVLDWVHKEPARRMTVARRVPLPKLDLLRTFHCQPSHNSLSRSFYLDIGLAAFVGKCPEVLLEWTPGKFNAYKLSGTYPKDKNPEIDERLLEQFLSDPKIIAEHRLSADGFGAGVAKVGEVSRQGPNVLNLDRLRHMMTAFSVRTDPGKTITDCLRAVLPPGVSPCAEGIPALLAIEKAKRGPYYGLVGMYSPDRKASFTQILRSVFRQHDDYYAWVGAAVTQGSTAKGELEESKLKLSDIVVSLK